MHLILVSNQLIVSVCVPWVHLCSINVCRYWLWKGRARGSYQSITSGCVSGDEMGRERDRESETDRFNAMWGDRAREGWCANKQWLIWSMLVTIIQDAHISSPPLPASAALCLSLPPFLILFPLSLPPSPLLSLSVFLSPHLCFLPVVFCWIGFFQVCILVCISFCAL